MKQGYGNRFKLALCSLALAGCTTTYNGLGPNLYVKEKSEREEQYAKFKLETPLFSDSYKLGNSRYRADSLLPIIGEISPEAAKNLHWGRRYVIGGGIVAALGLFSWYSAPSENRCLTCGPALLTYLGLGFYGYGKWKVGTGVSQYNERLVQSLRLQTEF